MLGEVAEVGIGGEDLVIPSRRIRADQEVDRAALDACGHAGVEVGGGHLVVIQKEARVHGSGPFTSLVPSYRYFDANHGHFRFQSGGAFLSWFRDFMTASGYAARYTKLMIVEFVTRT